MNNNYIDPGTKTEGQEDQAAINAAEDQANVGTELPVESAEEGSTEG